MGKIAIATTPVVTNQQINSLVINNNFPFQEYVYQYLKSIYPLLRSIAMGGTTMPIINKRDFENIAIPIPNKEILLAFETMTFSLSSKMQSNTKQVQLLTSFRDSLLPKLMSGEVRVKM